MLCYIVLAIEYIYNKKIKEIHKCRIYSSIIILKYEHVKQVNKGVGEFVLQSYLNIRADDTFITSMKTKVIFYTDNFIN